MTADKYAEMSAELRRDDELLTADIGKIFAELAGIARRIAAAQDRRHALEKQAYETHWMGVTAGVRIQSQPDDVRPLAVRAPVPAVIARQIFDALDRAGIG